SLSIGFDLRSAAQQSPAVAEVCYPFGRTHGRDGAVKRRDFIRLLGGAAAWPLAARAQQSARVFRIGFLGFGSASTWSNRVEALRAGLRDLGYVEGKNIVIEFRWTETIEQLPELATELVRMNVDLIFAPSSTEVEGARQVTNAIPIVFATH